MMFLTLLLVGSLSHLVELSSACNDKVCPSEYAYLSSSVYETERASANCRLYESGLTAPLGVFTDHYTHCDGTQLRLTDSDLGTQQYNTIYYYVWSAGEKGGSLLFTFQTRVNLTTITLHYYSDNAFGLPRLRFSTVPDNFNVWDALAASYSHVDVAAIQPGGEPAGRRNVSIAFNFTTKKLLMYKYRSDFTLSVSEVDFFTCNGSYSTRINTMTTATTTIAYHLLTDKLKPTSEMSNLVTNLPGNNIIPSINSKETTTAGYAIHSPNQDGHDSLSQGETAAAWGLFVMMTILFIVSLTVNVIMVPLWVYKKREVKGQNGQRSEFEIEGNPCYEATQMKQTTETETHLYETVQSKRGK